MPSSRRLEDYLRERRATLDRAGVPEAQLNLEWLAAERLNIPRLELMLHGDDLMADAIAHRLDADVERLRAGEPVQYIIGHVPFHGLSLRVDRRALIPRPETEWLVDQVLACSAIWKESEPAVVDVGTGSGCIALALAAQRPQAKVTGIDRDPDALGLALENRDRLGLSERVTLRQGDLLAGFSEASLDAVVSNPPYIAAAVCQTLDRHVREYEPPQALDGGPDGLSVIRRLSEQAFLCLKPGKPVWLEIGYDQGSAVSQLLSDTGYLDVAIWKDWAGQDRAACGFATD